MLLSVILAAMFIPEKIERHGVVDIKLDIGRPVGDVTAALGGHSTSSISGAHP